VVLGEVPGGPAASLLVAPVALVVGAIWGRSLLARKVAALGEGGKPGPGLPAGARGELAGAGLLLVLLLLPPFPAPAGLATFLLAAAGACLAYAHGVGVLADELDPGATPASLPEPAPPGTVELLGPAPGDPAPCPVCRVGLAPGDPGRDCPSCRTRYHAYCWSYARGCGVYGCPGRARADSP
jgi:hypothetical protein